MLTRAGKEFIVAYGFMPSKATLFDFKCNAVFDYGTGSRNTVSILSKLTYPDVS